MYEDIVQFIRSIYGTDKFIPLHEPRFLGNEKKYVIDAIDSTFVSSVGKYVDRFEEMMRGITGAKFAIATVNGTSALHVALKLIGVDSGDEVITSPLTFVATANAIAYCGAEPVFLDVEKSTLGLSPEAVSDFLEHHSMKGKDGLCYNRTTRRRIAGCVPVHIFGHPCRIDEIIRICSEYNISVVEDAAESLGSLYHGLHTGIFGKMGIYSFNGNKTVTCGGGGAIVTNDDSQARMAKHVTTTAKIPHPYEYVHDEVGYNYRLPNLNAALACAQLEQLEMFVENKRQLAKKYAAFFRDMSVDFVEEPQNARSNYWLNAIILNDLEARNEFLDFTNKCNVMTRPAWRLLNKLPMFQSCQIDELENAQWLEERVVNIPSSVKL
jgi:perosamine synthetase